MGLIGGIVGGYILSIILGFSVTPISKKFDIGLIKKKYRRAIAKDFFNEYKEEILSLKIFQPMSEDHIINTFSTYINEIHNFSAKLKTLFIVFLHH